MTSSIQEYDRISKGDTVLAGGDIVTGSFLPLLTSPGKVLIH